MRSRPHCGWGPNPGRSTARRRGYSTVSGAMRKRPYFEKAVGIIESDFHAWGMLASCFQALGDREGVLRAASNMISQSERVLAEDPSNAAAWGIGAGGLAIMGDQERTSEWIERALLIDPDNLTMRYNFACASVLFLKDLDAAIELLEPVFRLATRSFLANAETDPDLDGLRNDPRYKTLMAAAKARLAAAPSPTEAAERFRS